MEDGLELLPCDFCNSKFAVLYCKADSAKLCLFCDQRVHSANALSLRHLRSPICHSCRAEPASVRCYTENLMLCQDCDQGSHCCPSASSPHERGSVEGFSGCPSVTELAKIFNVKGDVFRVLGYGFGASEPKMLSYSEKLPVPKRSCSVFKVEVYEQLTEMGKKDMERINGTSGGAERRPETPPASVLCDHERQKRRQGWMQSLEVETFDEEKLLMNQQTPLTSLPSLPSTASSRETDCLVADGDLMWDWDPSSPSSLV